METATRSSAKILTDVLNQPLLGEDWEAKAGIWRKYARKLKGEEREALRETLALQERFHNWLSMQTPDRQAHDVTIAHTFELVTCEGLFLWGQGTLPGELLRRRLTNCALFYRFALSGQRRGMTRKRWYVQGSKDYERLCRLAFAAVTLASGVHGRQRSLKQRLRSGRTSRSAPRVRAAA
jgi:hypothetical protein